MARIFADDQVVQAQVLLDRIRDLFAMAYQRHRRRFVNARDRELPADTRPRPKPIVVMGLDYTVLDARYRTAAIIDEFLRSDNDRIWVMGRASLLEKVQELLDRGDFGYSARRNFCMVLGSSAEPHSPAVEAFVAYWQDRFFSNAWLAHDVPFPGVNLFIRTLLDMPGMDLQFLTGRHLPSEDPGARFPLGMVRGTELALQRCRMGAVPVTYKPAFDMPDGEYKECVLRVVPEHPVVFFDNEPESVNEYLERMAARGLLDRSVGVLVDTCRSDREVVLHPSAVVLRSYNL